MMLNSNEDSKYNGIRTKKNENYKVDSNILKHVSFRIKHNSFGEEKKCA